MDNIDTVSLIYDTSENPEHWPELLESLNKTLFKSNHTDTAEHAYVPHLQTHFERASKLNNKASQLQRQQTAMSNTLDQLPIGVMITNTDYTVITINQQATKTLELNPILSIQHGKLRVKGALNVKLLSNTIKSAVLDISNIHTHSAQLTMDNERSLSILATSINNSASNESLIAIHIIPPEQDTTINCASLAATYKLTPAETRLMIELASHSHCLNDAAKALNLSKHTIRHQMKNIFEKTDTHSQIELLKKIHHSTTAWAGIKKHVLPISISHTPEAIKQEELKKLHIIRLFDGRNMEYTEYGDPNGWPVIFLHSLLHSRNKFHPNSNYAEQHGIRIIAPERPGFGYSDPITNQSLQYYANDIQQLSQHLNLKAFDMIGDATGAAFALACASTDKLNGQLRHVGLISCVADMTFDTLDGLIPFERMIIQMVRNTPKSFHSHFATIIMQGMKLNPEKYHDLMYKHLSYSDQCIIDTPEKQTIFKESIANSFPDRTDGFISDYLIRLQAWDFSIKNIKNKVHLWHGDQNHIVHIKSAKKITQALPNCQPHFLKNQGHYIFITHWDEMLRQLTANHPNT